MNDRAPYKLDGFDSFVVLAAIPALLAFRTWVTLVLWRWFAVPVGLPALSYGALMGLVVLYGYMVTDTGKKTQGYDDAADFYGRTIAAPIVIGLLCLTLGFIIRGFTL